MKIDKYERYGQGKDRIYFDNGEVIETFDDVILKNNLLLKGEISFGEYQKIFNDSRLMEYYNACIKYISIRVRSIKEIRDYLLRKNVLDEDIDCIVSRLVNEKLLDDEYFTECFIKDKLNFTVMGEYKIINELKVRGISGDIIEKYGYLFDSDVIISRIEKLVDKQMERYSSLDRYKLRDKIYRYLLSQGYSSDSVVKVLNQKF